MNLKLKTGKYNLEKNIFTSPVARLAFASLFQLRPDFGGKLKYQACLIFDEDEVDLSLMRKVAKETLRARYPKAKFDFETLFQDGDLRPDTDGFPGNVFVNTNANEGHAPVVYDQQIRPIAEDDTPGIASGDYVVALLRPYTWDYKGKQGMSFGLVGVQLVRRGERFASGEVNAEELASMLDELPIDMMDIDGDDPKGTGLEVFDDVDDLVL